MADPLAPLAAALRDTVAWLDRFGTGAIIGGVATSILGRPRATRVVDCLALVPEERWREFVDSAAALGIVPRIEDAVAFARESRVLLLRHEPSGVDVDATLGAIPFEEELVARAERIDVAGLAVPVATAEDLAVMKAVAGRPRDLADIEGLLDARPMDVERVRGKVREFATLLEQPAILERLEAVLQGR